mmetsp:Transcript_35954/g.64265  ORF Transcript_35954/g.64265 Transcript_35954/m.64265 type:complete len:85 (-) Transcript_35954:812-1066(-)
MGMWGSDRARRLASLPVAISVVVPFPLNCPELEIAPPVWEGELLPWSFCCDKAKNTHGNKQVMMQNTTSTIQARVNKRKTVAGR